MSEAAMAGSRPWTQGLRMVAVLLILMAAGFPLYWMFVTSLTPSAQLFAVPPRALPTWSEIGVYAEAFRTIPVATWLLNSAIIAAGTTILSIMLAIFPAYALSRFRFRGMGLMGLGLFATQMLPEAMLVVPLYAIFAQLGLLNTLAGLILANTAFTVPVITWMLKGAIDGVPIDVEEAAKIDGCTRRRHRSFHRPAPGRAVAGRLRRHLLLPRLERIRAGHHADQPGGAATRLRRPSPASSASSARPSIP